jgi:putative heme-binding domain-containing protein
MTRAVRPAVENIMRRVVALALIACVSVPATGLDVPAPSGRALFEQRCSLCHGMDGSGGRGPNLRTAVLHHASSRAGLIAIIRDGIEPDMPAGWYFSDRDLQSLATYVESLGKVTEVAVSGDPEEGRLVFEQSGCLACHILSGRGQGYGPDLTYIGAARSAYRLRQTLVDPRSSLPADFLFVRVTTDAGLVIEGIRRNEDTLTLQIQDSTQRFHNVDKARLRSLERLRGETPMPSYADSLSIEQRENLVAFLAAQRRRS